MIEFWPPQDPDAKLDYSFDLRAAIADQGSQLQSYEIRITGPDSALRKANEVQSNGVIYFWLETPTAGATYTITCDFVLANGYRDNESRRLLGRSR